ncbi:hypothetical protein KL86DYS1_30423 [uncultured Dysgonomonas sp.]|uniref:Uncharacterized protein n=1 Tax=uncultured Dysgonomonas sp. TaxID=206096 RepID=A0A212JTT9_9BACT|nr:hypothetical protein KL86DYS1_30423 [uncultured Dysgonomonas sp.]
MGRRGTSTSLLVRFGQCQNEHADETKWSRNKLNVLNSKNRNKIYFDYAKSRKTTDAIEQFYTIRIILTALIAPYNHKIKAGYTNADLTPKSWTD